MALGPQTRPEWFGVDLVAYPSGSGDVHHFGILHDGTWIEDDPLPQGTEFGKVNAFELKILDLLIGQILKEPVPDTPGFEFPPQNNDETTGLTLEYRGRHTYRLYDDEPDGVSYYADDLLDVVEIGALNAFVRYLDRKYGTDPGEAIIG
jgi:hypothetical protein